MLLTVALRVIGAMAERRLCNRRTGRSPRKDDLRRFGVPRNSDAMSSRTLGRLRIVGMSGAISVAWCSVGGGGCRENLRVVIELKVDRGSFGFVVDAVIVIPGDSLISINGDG